MAATYTCKFCEATFLKPRTLSQHVRLVHGKEPMSCQICQKSFGRKDNLQRHLLRHSGKNHQCESCGKVFTRADNLQRHLIQHGGALPSTTYQQDSTPVVMMYPKDFYKIKKMKERTVPRFKTTAQHYLVTFENFHVEGLSNILITLRQLFDSLFAELTAYMAPRDQVQIIIHCPELDYPIVLSFRPQQDLTADSFLAEIERVLQSYEQFALDSTLEIQVTHVSMPSGSGKVKCGVNLEKFLHQKQCVIRINNKDKLCCARALVTAKAKLDNHEYWNSIRRGYEIQEQLATELHKNAGVPEGPCGVEEIKRFQAVLPGYQIYVISRDHFNSIVYCGPDADKKIYVYNHNQHYDVITSLPAFLSKNYFCHLCYKGYDHKEKHKCNNICRCCFREHEGNDCDQWIHCYKCNRYFKGQQCYNNHNMTSRKGNSTCRRYTRCHTCGKVIDKQNRQDIHRCGEIFCKTCREYVLSDHRCFMKPISQNMGRQADLETDETIECESEVQKEEQVTVYIFFDFECTQDSGIHEPNLCVVQTVCEYCLSEEVEECDFCGKRERVFSGETTRSDFCEWLFSGENSGAICICHNFQGYDSYFVLQYLYDNAVLPKVILKGTKVMSITVPSCDIRFIDSMNFLPMALRKLPSTFSIKEMCKGYFPHFFNTKENQLASLPHLPDAKFYHPEGMSPREREKFYIWYESNKQTPFDLQSELLRYCRSDVSILRRCCLRFRKLFMTMTTSEGTDHGIDPFETCITIASACNLVFRTKFLKPDSIGIIPPHGYHPVQKQSVKALQWMKYLSHTKQVRIRHAFNNKEFKVGNYPVDGYYETALGQKIILQFEGCLWHGCVKCFSRDTVNPVNNLTMEELYQLTMDKKVIMENLGYTYIQKWECDWDREVKDNPYIQDFVKHLDISEPLEPRLAFQGGRTEAFKLYKEISSTTKIKYKDVTSLYPWANKNARYVMGHPEIITENFQSLNKYEGLLKCKILPPKFLYIPVLGSKINGKLMFVLCRTCAENQQTECYHEDGQRALTGTWVIEEVKKALTKGYTLVKIYEVWHFNRTTQYDPITKKGGLFTEYINTFLKVKQEASGWPDTCITATQKQQYIDQYYDKEGIQLEWNRIEKNPGLRTLAKLMLNSFWGKFGQRNNLPQTTHITDPSAYFDMLTSDKQDVKYVRFVNDQMLEVQWQNKIDFVDPSARTNVVLAAYTTAHARLKLYELLETLGDSVLYADTDSVIYVEENGEDKLPTGNFLGDLTDELSGNHIVTFVSGGPKNYAYKLAKPDRDGNITHCKVKGVTLNYKNSLDIHFDSMSGMVRGVGPDNVTLTDSHCIRRDKANTNIVSKDISKDYRIVFDKRVMKENYDTIPYGY